MSKRFLTLTALVVASVSFGQTDILNENFQAGLPATWTIVDVDHQTVADEVSEYTSAWIIKSDPENPTDSVVSSTSFYNPIGRADKWLITPPITLGTFGNYLSFQAKSHDPSFPESYKILISTSNQVANFSDTVRLITLENPEWTTRELDLSTFGFNGQTVYLAFVLNTYDGFKLYLDDIRVRKEDPLGIQELAEIDAQIFPNPASEEFMIKGENQIDLVYIYSAEGKLINEIQYKTGQSISVSQLNSGVYFVKMKSGSNYKTVKLLKR